MSAIVPYHADDTVTIHHADCLDVLRQMPNNSIDAVVTDPPYGLEFMGREWDSFKDADAQKWGRTHDKWSQVPDAGAFSATLPRFTGKQGASLLPFQQWCEQWAAECLRVLKPGAFLAAFGGTRTYHRLTCAIEDAGFEIRDSIGCGSGGGDATEVRPSLLAWVYGSGFP